MVISEKIYWKKSSLSKCLNTDTKSARTDWKFNPMPSLPSPSPVLWDELVSLTPAYPPLSRSCPQTYLVADWPRLYCRRAIRSCTNVVTKFGIIYQVDYLKTAFLLESAEMESEGVRSVTIQGTEERGCGLWQGQRKRRSHGPPKSRKENVVQTVRQRRWDKTLQCRKGRSWTRGSVRISRWTYTLILQLDGVHDEGKL